MVVSLKAAYYVKVLSCLEVVHGTQMLEKHLPPRHAALVGLNLFDHLLDALAVPFGPRGAQILPMVLVLLPFYGKLCWVKGSLEHPLPFPGLKWVRKQARLPRVASQSSRLSAISAEARQGQSLS